MKRVIKATSKHEPVNLMITEQDGYMLEDRYISDLSELEVPITIPFNDLRIYFYWSPVGSKANTYELSWNYVDNSEYYAYEFSDVDDALEGKVEVSVETEYSDPDYGIATEFEPVRTYCYNNMYAEYCHEPIEDAMSKYMKSSEGIALKEKYEDELDTNENVIVELNGEITMTMRCDDIEHKTSSQGDHVNLKFVYAVLDDTYFNWVECEEVDRERFE